MTTSQKSEAEKFTPGTGKDCHTTNLSPSHQLKRGSSLAYRRVHPVGSKDRPSLKAYARECVAFMGTDARAADLAEAASAWLAGKTK